MPEKVLLRFEDVATDLTQIDNYVADGGYAAARKALSSMTPEQVIAAVKESGLRGRGGAGFPTGLKWTFVPKNSGKPVYVLCNADESEPGTFKDRRILEYDPHQLLEGILISSYAIGCRDAYIYIRGEFSDGHNALKRAIADAYARGFLGKSPFGTATEIHVHLHRGAGAYICGEETGLIESLEGKRAYPRIKPPFPAVHGFMGCPTIVNNVETLACVRHIIERGDAWFKAVIPGGSSVPVFTAEEIDVAMDFDSVAKAGSMLGSAGIIVMDETTCMVSALRTIARFYHHESCGQCSPCREGTGWLERILIRLDEGTGTEEDLVTLDSVARGMLGMTICVLADAAAMPVRSFLQKFRAEFEAHVHDRGCTLDPHQIAAA